MSVTADFAQGSSGAPIVNRQGNVVGMVCSTKSLYHEDPAGCQTHLQMVLKNGVPAECIWGLLEPFR